MSPISYAPALRGPLPHALLRRAQRRVLHRHRLRPPVYDNMSFAFYLKGWHGITVEPNPWLAELSRAVRPRDRHVEALVGGTPPGEAPFYLVHDFHGFSTMIADHARAAQTQFGKSSQVLTVPPPRSRSCARSRQVPHAFEFLKVDVEGAEPDVLLNGDWQRYRPKVVVVEALAPYTLAPAFEAWEPLLARHGYRYVWFRQPQPLLPSSRRRRKSWRGCFESAPGSFDEGCQFPQRQARARGHRPSRPWAGDAAGPHSHDPPAAPRPRPAVPAADRPISPRRSLNKPAGADDIVRATERLLGPNPAPSVQELKLPPAARLGEVYAALIDTDQSAPPAAVYRPAMLGNARTRRLRDSGLCAAMTIVAVPHDSLACGLHVAFAIGHEREAAVGCGPCADNSSA